MTEMIPSPLSVGLSIITLSHIQLEIFCALFEYHVLQFFSCPISGCRRFDLCKNAKPVQSTCFKLFNSDIESRWDIIAADTVVFRRILRILRESTVQIEPVWVLEEAVVHDLGYRIGIIHRDRATFKHFDQMKYELRVLL